MIRRLAPANDIVGAFDGSALIQGWKKSFYLNPEEFFAPAAE
jgi:hypothetical protein